MENCCKNGIYVVELVGGEAEGRKRFLHGAKLILVVDARYLGAGQVAVLRRVGQEELGASGVVYASQEEVEDVEIALGEARQDNAQDRQS